MSQFFTTIQPIKPIQPITLSEEKSGILEKSESSVPFASMLRNAINEYESLQKTADQNANALALGEVDNLAKVQIDSFKAQAALQTVVQLTSRAVNAYKEIMQMQV